MRLERLCEMELINRDSSFGENSLVARPFGGTRRRAHRHEVGPNRGAVDLNSLENHLISSIDFVPHEHPVRDSIHPNAGISIPRDPRDDGLAPDVVAAPSPTEKGPELGDG